VCLGIFERGFPAGNTAGDAHHRAESGFQRHRDQPIERVARSVDVYLGEIVPLNPGLRSRLFSISMDESLPCDALANRRFSDPRFLSRFHYEVNPTFFELI
jgi:hypothetical protein